MTGGIPLSQPDITARDIDAVVDVLTSAMLSIGPKVDEFEAACAAAVGRRHGVAVSSSQKVFTSGTLNRTANPYDVAVDGDGFTVVCADGRFKVSRVQPAEGKKIEASEWAKSVNLQPKARFT